MNSDGDFEKDLELVNHSLQYGKIINSLSDDLNIEDNEVYDIPTVRKEFNYNKNQ